MYVKNLVLKYVEYCYYVCENWVVLVCNKIWKEKFKILVFVNKNVNLFDENMFVLLIINLERILKFSI